MKRFQSIIINSIIIIIFLIVSISTGFYLKLNSSKIDISENLMFDGLIESVKVNYDSLGIPHIQANSREDALKAQGYLMARDRLWGMDFYRRQAKGELSEVFYQFDSSIIETDYSLRAIGLYRIAERDWENYTQTTKDFFNNFAEGVNSFITKYRKNLPIEFGILGYEPDLWNPIDSVALLKLIAFGMASNAGGEPLIGIGLSQIENTSILLDFTRLTLNNDNITWEDPIAYPKEETKENSRTTYFGLLKNLNEQLGSNNWVVSGNRTETGKPFVANDPHMGLETPSQWWYCDLQCPDFHLAGMTLQGIPGIILGRNDNLSWGFTNTQIDYIDTYVEKFSSNYEEYYYNGSWQETTILNERFYTNPSKTKYEEKQIYITTGFGNKGHGERPVIPKFGINTSIRWTGQDNTNSAEAIRKMAETEDMDSFYSALELFSAPGQNVVFADKIGNIGMYITGNTPIRKNGNGFVPHNGTTDVYEWEEEFIPFEEQYNEYNPSRGYIATANERIAPIDYDYFLGWAFADGYRGKRINQLLDSKSKHSIEDMKDIQTDVFSLWAEEVMNHLTHEFITEEENIEVLQLILSEWDKKYDIDSIGGTVFSVWTEFFFKNTIHDQIPNKIYDSLPIKGKLLNNLLELPNNNYWYDNINTVDIIEDKYNIIEKTFLDTWDFLVKKFGSNPEKWKWGNIHKVQFDHILGSVLDLFNAGGKTSTIGGMYTVCIGTYRSNYIQHHGSSMRTIMSLDQNNSIFLVMPPGQSGLLGSKHYSDQIKYWTEGKYYLLDISFNN